MQAVKAGQRVVVVDGFGHIRARGTLVETFGIAGNGYDTAGYVDTTDRRWLAVELGDCRPAADFDDDNFLRPSACKPETHEPQYGTAAWSAWWAQYGEPAARSFAFLVKCGHTHQNAARVVSTGLRMWHGDVFAAVHQENYERAVHEAKRLRAEARMRGLVH